MLIKNSFPQPRAGRAKPAIEKANLAEDSGKGKYVGAAVIGAGGLALGAGMIYKDEVASAFGAVKDALAPTLEVVAPIAAGVAQGAVAGMVTGGTFGGLATMDKHDSTPVFAVLGGGIGGLALGAVTGGVSAAFGGTPLLAIPAVIVGGAAFKMLA